MYASLDGFIEFAANAGKEAILDRSDLESLVDDAEDRLLAYIMPNEPRTKAEKADFAKAVYSQILYEQGEGNAQLAEMPAGVTGFTVNGFSATLSNGASDGVSGLGVSKRTRAILLHAGLLYKGVAIC